MSYTYFSPRPSSGGNLFDLRPRRIAFASPSSARPPPCSCGGATWAGCLDNPLFVSATTGNLSSGACGEVKFPVVAADSRTVPTNRDPAACGVSLALRRRPSSAGAYLLFEFQSTFRSSFLHCDQGDEPRLLGRSPESKKPPFIGHPALRVSLRWQLRRPTNDEGDQTFSFHGHVRWKGLFVTILGHI